MRCRIYQIENGGTRYTRRKPESWVFKGKLKGLTLNAPPPLPGWQQQLVECNLK